MKTDQLNPHLWLEAGRQRGLIQRASGRAHEFAVFAGPEQPDSPFALGNGLDEHANMLALFRIGNIVMRACQLERLVRSRLI